MDVRRDASDGPGRADEGDDTSGTDTTGDTERVGGPDTTGATDRMGATDTLGATDRVGGTKRVGATDTTGGTDRVGATDRMGATDTLGATDRVGGTDAPAVTLDGVAIHVRDVERKLAFYLRIPGTRQLLHRPGHLAVVGIGGNTLNLIRLTEQPPFHREVESPDVDALYRRLKEEGFAIEAPPRDQPWGKRSFYARDPEGNRIEFASRPSEWSSGPGR